MFPDIKIRRDVVASPLLVDISENKFILNSV
jgi:hypothetical protein